MCVNVDSFTFCLLKEKLQVIEVMSCYYDKWAFFYLRGTVTGVGLPNVSVFALSRSAMQLKFTFPTSMTTGRSSSIPQSSARTNKAL